MWKHIGFFIPENNGIAIFSTMRKQQIALVLIDSVVIYFKVPNWHFYKYRDNVE